VNASAATTPVRAVVEDGVAVIELDNLQEIDDAVAE
jgi:hypothetical protein